MASLDARGDIITIGGVSIGRGERANVDLPVARLYTHTELTMPVRVVRGRKPGPSLFVCAAIHGDEINGVEIIRRLLQLRQLQRLRGTLIAVPIVNVFGFLGQTRYLPDRRDLNRAFPGSVRGSLAARLADLFMDEIVSRCSHGIDLHTGTYHRGNLPQIRVRLDDPEAERLARAFGAPVVLDASLRDGSLREAVANRQVPVLLYEGGEALRFDEWAIRAGLRGVISVMQALGMLPRKGRPAERTEPLIARSSVWARAPIGGILRASAGLGVRVSAGEPLGIISDPFDEKKAEVSAPVAGLVIGQTRLPLVNEGDALFHLACIEAKPPEVMEAMESFAAEYNPPMFGHLSEPADGVS